MKQRGPERRASTDLRRVGRYDLRKKDRRQSQNLSGTENKAGAASTGADFKATDSFVPVPSRGLPNNPSPADLNYQNSSSADNPNLLGQVPAKATSGGSETGERCLRAEPADRISTPVPADQEALRLAQKWADLYRDEPNEVQGIIARAYLASQDEIARLRHDIARHVEIATQA